MIIDGIDFRKDNLPAAIEELKKRDDISFDFKLKKDLYPYQKVGALYHFLVKKSFNNDDPGLGKTAQSIALLTAIKKSNRGKLKAMVVATSTNLKQYEKEIKAFSDLSTIAIPSKNRGQIYDDFKTNDIDVLLMSYSKIIYDFDFVSDTRFDILIFDEATSLKDPKSQYHQYFKWLCRKAPRVLMLTATPIVSSILDYYNMGVCMGLPLPEYKEFVEHFMETKKIRVKGAYGDYNIEKPVAAKSPEAIEEFKTLMSPYFIRRENKNSAQYSSMKLNLISRPTFLTKEQKGLCQKLKDEYRAAEKKNKLKLFSDFTKITCSPYIYDSNYSRFSPKVEELISLIKSTDSKIIVFARFTEFHDIIERRFKEEKIKYVTITGKDTSEKRESNRILFWEDSSIQVLIMTAAGRFGMNLQCTNKLVLLDIPYTPSDVFQYIGRVFRTGQSASEVDVYFIYAKDSVEEDNFKLLYRKQQEIDIFNSSSEADIFTLDKTIDFEHSFLDRNYKKGPYYDED